ncbi:hypothetical protein LMG27952_05157 [Paraburkholderia hiiakae]|uniref:Oxidoreductase molybdopterin-binding domain-containing protein n=2 Tax=Paraburkholderia hiiakae TaxID=1081782 RepID=A0ABN7I3L7_9BURK|nr:hypothetical protein LMG27952_05157 [Paraburkholderia hiiakae]
MWHWMGWPGWRRWAAVAGFALAGALLSFVQLAHAAQAAVPAGSLSLDVDGEVRVTNDVAHTAYHFTEAQLLALPAHSITTATTWTPRSTFTGPLLSDVLKAVGAYGSEIEIHTLDDYTCVVPVADAARYGVVVAYAMNGQRLKVSNFGPLFLIYPRDQHPLELDGAAGDAKFAWQIKSMTIKR